MSPFQTRPHCLQWLWINVQNSVYILNWERVQTKSESDSSDFRKSHFQTQSSFAGCSEGEKSSCRICLNVLWRLAINNVFTFRGIVVCVELNIEMFSPDASKKHNEGVLSELKVQTWPTAWKLLIFLSCSSRKSSSVNQTQQIVCLYVFFQNVLSCSWNNNEHFYHIQDGITIITLTSDLCRPSLAQALIDENVSAG